MLLSCSGMAPAVGAYVMNGSAAVIDNEMKQAKVVKNVRVMLFFRVLMVQLFFCLQFFTKITNF